MLCQFFTGCSTSTVTILDITPTYQTNDTLKPPIKAELLPISDSTNPTLKIKVDARYTDHKLYTKRYRLTGATDASTNILLGVGLGIVSATLLTTASQLDKDGVMNDDEKASTDYYAAGVITAGCAIWSLGADIGHTDSIFTTDSLDIQDKCDTFEPAGNQYLNFMIGDEHSSDVTNEGGYLSLDIRSLIPINKAKSDTILSLFSVDFVDTARICIPGFFIDTIRTREKIAIGLLDKAKEKTEVNDLRGAHALYSQILERYPLTGAKDKAESERTELEGKMNLRLLNMIHSASKSEISKYTRKAGISLQDMQNLYHGIENLADSAKIQIMKTDLGLFSTDTAAVALFSKFADFEKLFAVLAASGKSDKREDNLQNVLGINPSFTQKLAHLECKLLIDERLLF